MDIGDAENQLKKADSFLTTLVRVLRKHWKILILITILLVIYWRFTTPAIKPMTCTGSYEETLPNGSVQVIETYSDGTEKVVK